MSLVNQTYFVVTNSITYDSTNVNAVDISSPLILTDWLKYFNLKSDNIINEYNQYLLSWFKTKNITKSEQTTYTTDLYINLFKSIAINYSTAEEQRFIQNVDYTDIKQVMVVLPFFTRKIKKICLYYNYLRENVKTSVVKNNLRGSNLGIERIVYNDIISSLNDTEIQNILHQNNINIEGVKNKISVEIDPLYDTSTYFDLSANDFDPSIFYGFNQAISNKINSYPTFISELSSFFTISLESDILDLTLLKDGDFINNFNNLDASNLNLNTISEFVPTYMGTDLYYLSTNSTATTYVSGSLFKASNKAGNILNKRNATVAIEPLSSNLLTHREIGGFFTPEKMGIVNFYSFKVEYKIATLKPNTVYIFPDPNTYGNISNLTQVSYDSPFIFDDDISYAKVSTTNTANRGRVNPSNQFKTFYPYSSRSENLQTSLPDLVRYTDPQDFFEGTNDSIWSNEDIFPLNSRVTYPIDSRYTNLLVDNYSALVEYKTDIYGNQFGLFKQANNILDPQEILAQKKVYTCLHIDGGSFNTAVYDTVLLTSDTGPTPVFLSATPPEYYILSPLFNSANICETLIDINIDQYSGGSFTTPQEYSFNIWGGGAFSSSNNNNLNSGPYIINGSDINDLATFNGSQYLGLLSANNTTTTEIASALESANRVGLYEEREQIYGNICVRLNGGSTIHPLSSVFSNIFDLANGSVVTEIKTKLKHFDIVYNTLVLQTENYCTFIPYSYNSEGFQLQSNSIQYISNLNSFEKISNTWYNEHSSKLFNVKIKSLLDDNNHQIVYPEIYEFSNHKLVAIYPPVSSIAIQIDEFSVYNHTDYQIHFTSVETPIFTYNTYLDKYLISFIARDSSGLPYIFNYRFKLNSEVYNIESELYKPRGFSHTETFLNNTYSELMSTFKYPAGIQSIALSGGTLLLS